MAESGTLLRCYTGNCIGGSNPPLSAKKTLVKTKVFFFAQILLKTESRGMRTQRGSCRNEVETSEANPPLSAKGNPQLEKSCGFFIFTVILRTRVLKIIV